VLSEAKSIIDFGCCFEEVPCVAGHGIRGAEGAEDSGGVEFVLQSKLGQGKSGSAWNDDEVLALRVFHLKCENERSILNSVSLFPCADNLFLSSLLPTFTTLSPF
jgi:hypothetical protein